MAYRDLRAYLTALDDAGLVLRVGASVDRSWEISAVCRRLFQRVPEARRPALLFEHVAGSDVPVAAGVLGASRRVYACALGVAPERVADVWDAGVARPIAPRVSGGSPPCQEVVRGEPRIDFLPVPVWTPGEDPSPYLTAACVVSRDPQTGTYNVGTYRIQVPEDSSVLPMNVAPTQHLYRHVERNERGGSPTPVAVVLGADPVVGLVSASKFGVEDDELALAGGIRGEALDVAPCVSQPLHVPATAEVVIEGELLAGERVAEGPFGEYTGYMGPPGRQFAIHVTAVTHRRQPILQTFVSQMPPSESSCIRSIGRGRPLLQHLRGQLGLPVADVHLPESGSVAAWVIVRLERTDPGLAAQVIAAVWSFRPRSYGKIVVVVDGDIDIHDHFQVEWALAWHLRPQEDVYVLPVAPTVGMDPSLAPADVSQNDLRRRTGGRLGLDATRKHAYPAVSLPAEDLLRRVDARWREYGLPEP